MPIVTRSYNVTGCHNCPDCEFVSKLGQGGFDDGVICICQKGAYGTYDDIWKWQGGYRSAPTEFPVGCPYLKEFTGSETLEDIFNKYSVTKAMKLIRAYAKTKETK